MSMSLIRLIAVAFAALCPVFAGAQAVEQPTVKFTLDWAFQGPQSIFTYAAESGAFKNEGLTVQVDRGAGSADAVSRVATGTYEFGWAEMSAVIKYNADHPDRPLIAVYVTHENSANAVMSIKGRGIAVPKDLEGKKVGSTAGSAARDVFDAFARVNGFDPTKIKTETVTGALRETMLVRGDVDAITGFTFTSLLNIEARGVKAEDVVVLPYPQYGVRLYGNAIIVSPKLLQENPAAIKAFLSAFAKGMKDVIANPEQAIETVKARDGIINSELETRRLKLALETVINSPEARAEGFGQVKPGRLSLMASQVSDAFNTKTRVNPDAVWNGGFLPSAKELDVLPVPKAAAKK